MKATPQATPQATAMEQKIINEMIRNPKISRSAIAKKLGVSPDTVKEYLSRLKQKKVIERIGITSSGYWNVIKK